MRKIFKTIVCAAVIIGSSWTLVACDKANASTSETSADIESRDALYGLISSNNQSSQQMVYICTGPNSKRYHRSSNCKGFNRCSGSVRKLSVEQARQMGRTPCKWCY